MNIIDKKAVSLWQNANKSLKNYQLYIDRKQERYLLTLIDLLYISNFKGGNASIHEEKGIVNARLSEYTTVLKKIAVMFDGAKLQDLDSVRTKHLIDLCSEFISLTNKLDTCIHGFKASYASGLLHAIFPTLIPILDRRVMLGIGLATSLNSAGQIRDIGNYLESLVIKIQSEMRLTGKSLREIDQLYFSRPLN